MPSGIPGPAGIWIARPVQLPDDVMPQRSRYAADYQMSRAEDKRSRVSE